MDINIKFETGWAPLHYASQNSNLIIIDFLI